MSVDIPATVAEVPHVQPLPGLPEAWEWRLPNHPVACALATTQDSEFLFQLVGNDDHGYTRERAVHLLSFAREHTAALLAATPFAVMPGFSMIGTGFDCLVSVIPTVADFNQLGRPELTKITYVTFPAWRCEISEDESEEEARFRFHRELEIQNFGRAPDPFLRMLYGAPDRETVSMKDGSRGRAPLRRLRLEWKQLREVDGSFVELENFRGQERRLEWHDRRAVLVNRDHERPLDDEQLSGWLHAFLHNGDEEGQ